MTSFKLRDPSGSALRDANNSSIRGPGIFAQSLEAILNPILKNNSRSFKLLNLVLDRYIYNNDLIGGYSNSSLDNTVDAGQGSSYYDGNPISNSQLLKNVLTTKGIVSQSLTPLTSILSNKTLNIANSVLNTVIDTEIIITSILQSLNLNLTANSSILKNSLRLVDSVVAFSNNIPRLVKSTLNASSTLIINFKKFVAFRINYANGWTSSLFSQSSRLITFAINEFLNPSYIKNTNKLVNNTLLNTLRVSRSTQAGLSILALQSVNLFTQSLRFVSLAILSSQNIVRRVYIGFSLNKSVQLLTTINKAPAKLLESVLTSFQLSINRIVLFNRTTSASLTAFVSKSLHSSLSLLSSSTVKFKTHSQVTISQLASLTSNLIKTTSALIAVSISSLFDTNLRKIVQISISASLPVFNNIQKSIAFSVQLINNFSSLVLTQSLRFVSLTILAGQNLVQSFKVNTILNNLTTFTPSSNRQSIINLKSVALSFSTYFSKLVNFTILSTINLFEGLSKSISAVSSTTLSSTVNLNKLLIITLSSINSFASNLFKVTSASITVAINNLFNSNMSKVVSSSVNASASLTNSFNKSIDFNIGLINYWSSLIFNQSLRFITLAINNNYAVSFVKQLSVTIAYINNLNTTVQKQIANVFNITSSFVSARTSNISRALSISSIFDVDLRRSYAKYLNYSSIFDPFLSPGAFYDQFLEVTLTNTVVISTASLRFVSLAITSSYNQIISKLNSITKTVNFATVNSLLKRTSINIVLSASYSANIFNQTFRLVSLAVTSAFNSTFALRIYSSTNINNNFNTANQFSIFKTIDRIINFNSNFNRSIRITLNVVSTFLSNLSRATSFNLSLSIISGFNNSISRITSILLNNSLSTSLTDQKSIEFNRSFSSTFAADIFYPSILRLMSLSVLAAQNVSLNNAINKTINRTYASVLNISRNSSILLQTTSNSFVLTIRSSIQSSLTIATNSLILFNKAINYEVPVNLQGSLTLSRRISFALSQTINNSINLIKTTSALVSANLNVLFDISITKAVNYAITTTVTLFNQFTNSIDLTIRSINSFASLIFTQSFRFITLAIVSGQNVNNNFNVFNTINNLATFTTNTTRLISATLSTIVSASVLVIRKVVLSTINVGINFAITISNAIFYSIKAVASSSSNIAKSLNKTLTQITEFASSIVKTTSALITASINSLFDSSIKRLIDFTQSTSLTANNNIQRSINFNIQLLNTLANFIFTQSLRFVSLAITSGQNIVQQTRTFFSITTPNSLLSNLNKNVGVILQFVFDNVVTQIQSSVTVSINLLADSVALIQKKVVSYNIKLNVESLLNISTRSFLTLTTNLYLIPSVFKTTSALLTMTINNLFESSISRLTSATINVTNSATVSFNRVINFNLNLLSNISSLIFTQSLRFVSLAIVSAQTMSQRVAASINLNSTASLIANINRSIAVALESAWSSLIIEVKTVILPGIYVRVDNLVTIPRSIKYQIVAGLQQGLNVQTSSFFAVTSAVTLASNILKTTSSLVAVALNNLFTANLSKTVNKFIDATFTTANNIAKSIEYSIKSINNFTSLVLTQSLRFVSLAILSNQNTAQQVLTSFSLNNLVNLATALQNRIFTTLQSAWNSAVVEIKNVALPGIYVRINYVAATSKSISYSIVAGLQQGLNIQTSVFFALSSGVAFVSNTLKTTSSLITVAINNLFEANLSRLTNFLVDTTLTSSNSFSRSVNYSIKSINNFASLVFTQSFRFVTLAVLFGQDVAQQLAAFFTINNTISLFAAIQRRTLTTIQSVWDSTILEIKNVVLLGIYVRINYLASTQKLTSFSISATLTNVASWQTKLWIALSRSMTLASNIFKTTSSLISVAVNNLFEASLQRLSSITVPSTFTTNNNFARSINFAVKLINNFSSLVLTQSLRFISLAIVSGQDLAIKVYSTLALPGTFSGVAKIQKNIINTIRASFDSTIIDLKTVVLPGIYLYINSVVSINKSMNYQINALTSGIVAFLRSIRFSINLSNGYMTLLISSFNKLVNITINIYSGFEEQIQKLIKINLRISSSFIVQFLRFINTTISNIFNIGVSFIKSINYSLKNLLVITLQQNRIIYVNRNSIVSTNLWFKKVISIKVQYSTLQNIRLLFRSSFYVVFNLLSNFNSNTKKNVRKTLRVISNNIFTIRFAIVFKVKSTINYNLRIGRSIQKRITNLITNLSVTISHISYFLLSFGVISLFTPKLLKRRPFTISFNETLSPRFQNRTSKFIRNLTTFNNSLSFLSYRFVKLMIMNQWSVRRTVHVSRSIRITSNFITLLKSNFKLFKLIEFVVNLPARRSHTLYSVLTSFAVNKSKPGSDGSAQQTQRKSGGSARKRNINNNSSTFFRRGKTDDLE